MRKYWAIPATVAALITVSGVPAAAATVTTKEDGKEVEIKLERKYDCDSHGCQRAHFEGTARLIENATMFEIKGTLGGACDLHDEAELRVNGINRDGSTWWEKGKTVLTQQCRADPNPVIQYKGSWGEESRKIEVQLAVIGGGLSPNHYTNRVAFTLPYPC